MKKTIVFPEIHLQRLGEMQSLRQQIERQIAYAIRNGSLPYGSRLPSSRLLARLLQVSRGTVVDAYEALLEAGTLTSRAGSGTTVASLSPSVPSLSKLKKTAVAAHFPARVCRFEDWEGTQLYLNGVY